MNKRVVIDFKPEWLLQHQDDYDVFPVERFAEIVHESEYDVDVIDYSAFSCCIAWNGNEFTEEQVKQWVGDILKDKFDCAENEAVAGFGDVEDYTEDEDDASDEEAPKAESGADEADDEEAERARKEASDALLSIFDKQYLDDEDGESGTDGASESDKSDSDESDEEEDEIEDEEDKEEGDSPFSRMMSDYLEQRTAKAGAPQEKPKELTDILRMVGDLRRELSGKIMGQSHAIEEFVTGLYSAEIHTRNGKKRNKPRAVFLFAGPPGVGKTYLAETAANFLGLPYLRLDMSGFSDKDMGPEGFSGVQASYKSAHEGQVTGFVEENPECVLLFDEMEKAHLSVVQLFLQILEGARLRDLYTERDVSFEKAIIIMTTNAGSQLYSGTDKRNFSDVSDQSVIRALRNDINPGTNAPLFPAPILSRLAEGTVVMFNHLEPYALCDIVGHQLSAQVADYLESFRLNVSYDADVPKAVLYSAGGMTDARTLKGAAKSLIDDAMLELFDHGGRGADADWASRLKEIRFTLDFEDASEEANALFRKQQDVKFLLFCEEGTLADGGTIGLVRTDDLDKAKEILREEIDGAIVDISCRSRQKQYVPRDPEDVDSDGVELFRYLREYYPEMPVYILNSDRINGDPSAFRSFIRAGARDVIDVREGKEAAEEQLARVAQNVKMLREAMSLFRANNSLGFNCAQVFSEDGTRAEIKLAALCVKKNIAAEDSEYILDNCMRPNVHFSDVIGAKDAKETLTQFISFLKNPRKYLASGVRAPRGVLLYGPPGTGKTLLAKAMAGESDVTFIQKNATQFFNKYIGEGPRSVRETFRMARKYAPAVLFVDEVDSIAKPRTGSEFARSSEELLNTFLSEMDGFVYDEKRPVLVLAATNFGIEDDGSSRAVLDPAFVRRFDRKIRIDLPNTEERAQFIAYYLKKHGIDYISQSAIDTLARRTIGKSPANLEMIVEFALRNKKGERLTEAELQTALDAESYGEEREWKDEVVRKTTCHEAGHALVSYFTGKTPTYLTNISRGSFGGYMLPAIEEDKFDYTLGDILDEICCAMGGRAAEIVCYGKELGTSTGASSDLRQATEKAKRLICNYGMDEEYPFALDANALSGEMKERVYQRIGQIVKEQLERAISIISSHKDAMDALVDALYRKNGMDGAEIEEVLSPFFAKKL